MELHSRQRMGVKGLLLPLFVDSILLKFDSRLNPSNTSVK
jgi:hypothetical protein